MYEEKSHDWEEIYANCDFGLSSEPRAKDVRRKPILAERKRITSERVRMGEWMGDGSERRRRAKENTEWETCREMRSECAKKKLLKKSEEIIQREPTPLPTGGSAYMYCKVKTTSKW